VDTNNLKKKLSTKKRRREDVALGDLPHIREALEGARDLVAEVDANRIARSDGESVAALFTQDEGIKDRRAASKIKKLPVPNASFRAAKAAVIALKHAGYTLGRNEQNYIEAAIERSLYKFFPTMVK
jgi:hypothetical protein